MAQLVLLFWPARRASGAQEQQLRGRALHRPAYWHDDVLAGLRVLLAVDPRLLADPRAADGLDLLESKALADGRFGTTLAWWQAGRRVTSPTDVIDWGSGQPSEVLTLHAISALKSAGRW